MEGNFEKESKKDMLTGEAEIVERAKNDDQAFEILYDFYFPKIYGYIFKRVGSFDAAEDLVSATFLKVFTGLAKYNNKGNTFGAWVYKIATNNLIDYYRKEGKNKKIDIDNMHNLRDENNAEPGKSFALLQEKKLVRKILKEMPENYLRVLYLKFFGEKETREIADILQTNENNVRVLLCRALKEFNKIYKSYVQ